MVKAVKSLPILIVLALALCLGLVVALGLPAPVSAAEFHVATAAQFRDALEAAEINGEDDIIYLAAGTYVGYFEYLPPDTEHKSLTIRGEPGTSAGDVILDGQASDVVLRLNDMSEGDVEEMMVAGITVQNGNRIGYGGGISDIVRG